jgi:hypothetical protein
MAVMLLAYIAYTDDHDAATRFKNYGNMHAWIIGRGPISRTLMTPPIISIVHKMSGAFEGKPTAPYKQETSRGYEDHLDAVWALLNAMVYDGMPKNLLEKVTDHASDQPRNALFSAIKNRWTTGNQADVIGILLDETIFPKDRLPTSKERCEEYLWQRDQAGDDWRPCPSEGKTHDGVDFLIAAWAAGLL